MTNKTWLTSSQCRVDRRSSRCITSDRESLRSDVSICLKTEECEQIRKVVADVIDVLLGIDELVVGRDSISSEEAVICSGILQYMLAINPQSRCALDHQAHQTRTRPTDISRCRSNVAMSIVAIGRDTEASLLIALLAISSIVVRVFGVERHSGLVISIERALCSASSSLGNLLAPSVGGEHRIVYSRNFGHPWKSKGCLYEEEGWDDGLHLDGSDVVWG